MSLVKHDQILSLFNQAYFYTNYCVFSVVKCFYLRDFMNLVKHDQILSLFITKPIIVRIIVSLVFENIIVRASVYCVQKFYDFG